MKSEVSFFKRKGASLFDTMKTMGMTDREIKIAMLKYKADEAYEKVKAAKSIGPDAVSAAYQIYRDAYAEWYKATQS